MRDALASNQAVYRSLKQDTLRFRHSTFLLPSCMLSASIGYCDIPKKHMLTVYLTSTQKTADPVSVVL